MGENFRGINAVRVLENEKGFTIDKTILAGYNTYLAAFEVLVPALVQSFEKNIKPGDPLFEVLAEPVAVLKNWDFHAGEKSVATTLAVEWAQNLIADIRKILY